MPIPRRGDCLLAETHEYADLPASGIGVTNSVRTTDEACCFETVEGWRAMTQLRVSRICRPGRQVDGDKIG